MYVKETVVSETLSTVTPQIVTLPKTNTKISCRDRRSSYHSTLPNLVIFGDCRGGNDPVHLPLTTL